MKRLLSSLMLGTLVVALQGCGSSTAIVCTASGSVVSGTTTTANTTVSLDNISVSITNGTGPYNVTLPGLAAVSSTSAIYTYTGTVSAITGPSGGITSTVSVTDTSNSNTSTNTASCVISATTLSSGTNGFVITPSPSASVAVGSTITLSASSTDGTVNPTFTFSLSTQIAGVYLTTISSTEASVTSSGANTVTVTASEYASGTNTLVNSSSVVLYFGTSSGTGTGGLNVSASPSSSVAVGSTVTLFASSTTGAINPTFTFSLQSQISGTYLNTIGSTEATVTSSVASTVTVLVTEYSNGVEVGTSTETLYFGTSGGGVGGLTCSLSVYSYSGSTVYFSISSSTGEAVNITSLSSTLPNWYYYGAVYEYGLTILTTSFSTGGYATLTVNATGANSGLPCNGGSGMQTGFTAY